MSNTSSTIEPLADYQCICGENPLWHDTEQVFYWTDIPTGRLFRYDPATGQHENFYKDRSVGGFTFQADDSLLLFMDRGTVAEMRDGKITRHLIEEIPDERESRFNDVMADPEGRVFAGTMPVKGDNPRLGRLYRIDPDGSYRILLEGIGCSNGMGFTPDGQHMYYTDSTVRKIYLFDYDRATGDLTNQRVFFELPENPDRHTVPDGMTVDCEGYVWSALWGGQAILRINPQGEVVQRVEMPAINITSLCFGGRQFEQAYITTATAGTKPDDPGNEHGGKLLRADLGVKGAKECRSRIGL